MLTKGDKIEVREIVVDALTEVMMPVLDKIIKTQEEHTKDIAEVKEDLEDVKLTVNRIESLQKHELSRVDDHELRIVKLEKAI